MSSNNRVLQIYNSRKTILNLLESKQNYDIDEYKGFSINEIDAMLNRNQLDMLLTDKKKETDTSIKSNKTYVKYYLKSNLNDNTLQVIIEDLFILSDTLNKNDTLIVIYDGEPNDSLKEHLKYKYNHDNVFVVVHNIKRLQFNILEHILIPSQINILTSSQIEELIQKMHLKNTLQLPEISRFDPLALAICLRPGQICKFERKSQTALNTDYYRVCV
jgi:DNA-directed RNA polymerase subunit H (RpoH/RPB5)